MPQLLKSFGADKTSSTAQVKTESSKYGRKVAVLLGISRDTPIGSIQWQSILIMRLGTVDTPKAKEAIAWPKRLMIP